MYDWTGRCHSLCKCPSVYEETPPVTSTLDSRLRRNDALEISFRLFACPSVPRIACSHPRPSLGNHAVPGRSLVRQYPSANGSDCFRSGKMIGDAFDRGLGSIRRGSLSFQPPSFFFFLSFSYQSSKSRHKRSCLAIKSRKLRIVLTIVLSSCYSSKSWESGWRHSVLKRMAEEGFSIPLLMELWMLTLSGQWTRLVAID